MLNACPPLARKNGGHNNDKGSARIDPDTTKYGNLSAYFFTSYALP